MVGKPTTQEKPYFLIKDELGDGVLVVREDGGVAVILNLVVNKDDIDNWETNDTRETLIPLLQANLATAFSWYEKAVEAGADQVYIAQARMAEIILQGAEDLER